MALLDQKVAIVTGCASGIGLATTKSFLDAGARVFGIDISPFPSPSPLSSSNDFTFHQANLLEASAADNSIAACVKKYGRVDILANVAGVMDNYESADNVSDAQWERVMGINALVPMRMMRAVLNEGGMKDRKHGSIINVSSKSGLSGAAAGSSYTASKHAVVGLTKNTAWRFRFEGIRCNAVCPGSVGTGIGNSIDSSKIDTVALEHLKPIWETHRQNGVSDITAGDIANSILYLASDLSSKVSGVILPVDKAWSTI